MKVRSVILCLCALLLAAAIACSWELWRPWLDILALQCQNLLHKTAIVLLCICLLRLLKPIAGCLVRVVIFLLALIFIL